MAAASDEWQALRAALQPGLADAADPLDVVREKLLAVHPTDYADDVSVQRRELGGVPAAIIATPETEGREPLVMMVHGGAFVATGIDHYIPYAASLARILRARFAIFEYRLAPEQPFPAALEDTLAVYRALLADGVDPGQLAVIGDSCGGGIALAALLQLRDAGEPLPAAYAGLTPWLDLEMNGDAAHQAPELDPFVNAAWIRARARDYAGTADLRDPRLSPLYGRFHDLPPLWLSTGEFDSCRDGAASLAQRARADGVELALEVVPEMIHGFHGLNALAPECHRACQRLGQFLSQQWMPAPR